ncbi:MAG TPA: LLM class flavin-dependent oxidoreductase [Solirubrobacteraceae bacterium]|nr:LLM class flavin-dependent oxidoreductase [Solirubrobacteraceae bacterium]
MQFGIFSVSDVTRDPVSGRTPSEAERIRAIVRIAQRADEVGLDVFAIGEHHNPPFFSSSPTTLLAHVAALTERIILSTSVTLRRAATELALTVHAGIEHGVAEQAWSAYQHRFAGNAARAERTADDIDFETPLTRLAAGGTLESDPHGDASPLSRRSSPP